MDIQINSGETKLSDNYFDDLAMSTMKNMENCNLFQNFVDSDLRIEVLRALKLASIKMIINDEAEDYLNLLDDDKD